LVGQMLVGMSAAFLMAGAVCVSPARGQSPGPALVTVTPIVQESVAAGQTFVGSVAPVRKSLVGSALEGRVSRFELTEGDFVKAGQELVRLNSDSIEIELAGAVADLEVRKHELTEAEHGPLPMETAQAKSRMLGARARWEFFQNKLQRTQSLYKTKAASEEELRDVILATTVAEEGFNEAQLGYDLSTAGTRQEKIEQSRARVRVQEEAVRLLKEQLALHTIVAPFDGYLVARHTELGQWVARGASVAEVAQLDPVDVTVFVLEDYISFLQIGTTARVQVGPFLDHAFTGKIAVIVPHASERSRSFPVKIRVANPKLDGSVALKSGMFARVTLPVGRTEEAMLIPKDALVLGQKSSSVWVVDSKKAGQPQGQARKVAVELGVAKNNLIQIRGEVRPGQLVVVQGNDRLQPGQQIVWREPETSRPLEIGGAE